MRTMRVIVVLMPVMLTMGMGSVPVGVPVGVVVLFEFPVQCCIRDSQGNSIRSLQRAFRPRG